MPFDPDKELLTRFLEAVDKEFSNDHHVRDYASLLSVSERKLYVVVPRITGDTPLEIINGRRESEARHLLSSTCLCIKRIASDLGFADESYFSKFFRKRTGMSPSDYRTCSR